MASDSKLAVVSTPTPPPRRRCGRRCRLPAWRTASCWAASSGGASRPTRTSSEASSSTTSGRRRTRSPTSRSCWRRCEGLVSDGFIADAAARLRARADERARVAVPAVAHRLERPRPRSAAHSSSSRSASRLLPDHPKLGLDSLHERADAPVPGLTHRYTDKALFLPLDTCPVYCRFCTRSYAVGIDTEEVEKVQLKVNEERWQRAFEYIASRPELEDIVISGGDAYNLRARADHADRRDAARRSTNIRRMRFATKGPAVMPQKILTDDAWIDALTRVVEQGRKLPQGGRAPHPLQPPATRSPASPRRRWTSCSSAGSRCATRAVLQRRVNDSVETMTLLVQAPRPRQRAPVLRLRARPGERASRTCAPRWRPASTSRSTCAAPRRASTRRRSSSTRPAAAASATRTRTSTTTARPASRCSPRPACIPARCTSTSIRSTCCPPEGQARWADPASTQTMVDEARAAAAAAPH